VSLDQSVLYSHPKADQLHSLAQAVECMRSKALLLCHCREAPLHPQAHEVDTLNDEWQAAILFWGGAQRPTHSQVILKGHQLGVPSTAAACCGLMLLLFGNLTLPHSQVMTPYRSVASGLE